MRDLPDDLVQNTLDSLDILVVNEVGNELVALCPGHEQRTGKVDHNPSWSIHTITGVHYCFSCGFKGNLYTLVRDVKGLDAAERMKADIEIHGRPVSNDKDIQLAVTRPQIEAQEDEGKPESWLTQYDEPPQWALDARRISAESARRYGVRWSTKTSSWILPLRNPKTLRLIGYQVKGQKNRLFRNRPMRLRKASTFFGWDVVQGSKQVVVVESPLDAVLLADMKCPAVAICGSRISDQQVELLQQFDWVFLWLDADVAGQIETDRLRKVMTMSGIRSYSIRSSMHPEWQKQGWKDVGEMPDEVISDVLDAARL